MHEQKKIHKNAFLILKICLGQKLSENIKCQKYKGKFKMPIMCCLKKLIKITVEFPPIAEKFIKGISVSC